MTPGWCSIDEAAEYFGISVPKLEEAMADSERAAIALPCGNHGTSKKLYLRWCVAKLDEWMLEVLAWRQSVSSKAGSTKSDGTTPTAPREPSRSRTGKTRSNSSGERKAQKSGARDSYREKVRHLESVTR